LSQYVFKLPDVAEGTVEAELVAWRVQVGDEVNEDDPLVEVTTEKAVVELRAPVGGRVIKIHGAAGDRIAVGADLAVFETNSANIASVTPAAVSASPQDLVATPTVPESSATAHAAGLVLTSPAIRRLAREESIDLSKVPGSGPGGRVLLRDLKPHLGVRTDQRHTAIGLESNSVSQERGPPTPTAPAHRTTESIEEVRIFGIRRVIAERMQMTLSVPHFSYVEEVDVTELESLRVELNAQRNADRPGLSYLPFLVCALVVALRQYPQCNAIYEAEREAILRYRAAHIGIATQTASGLKVPVLRDAQDKSLHQIAQEIRRLSTAARENTATRAELSGSTITITSLGKLGGIATTPIINVPELAIIGVNRAIDRPVVREGQMAVRRMMNLSSSFDHRFIDGHEAAAFIQCIRSLLEHPASIFIDH
jgi:2-oxoisovalerate dehydrogenase E2 component (dihydrolipoyl transacylase)